MSNGQSRPQQSHLGWAQVFGILVIAVGGLLSAIGVIICIIAPFSIAPFNVSANRSSFLSSVLAFIIGSLILLIGRYVLQLGKRLTAVRITYAASEAPRFPVLYLRSFKDEKKTRQLLLKPPLLRLSNPLIRDTLFSLPATEEELLAEVLQNVGGAVAVGAPGERL